VIIPDLNSNIFDDINNSSMKRLFVPILIILSAVACDNAGTSQGYVYTAPDTGDLVMTGDVQKVFAARREAMLDTIGDGVLLLRADYGFDGGRHEYRVASNFWYLTGYGQPGTIMSLTGGDPDEYALYTRQRSVREIIYSGNLPDQNEVLETWNPDTIRDYREADMVVADAAREGRDIFIDYRDQQYRGYIAAMLKQLNAPETILRDIGPSLAAMRVFKDEYEIRMLQKAAGITGEGIAEALKVCRPGMYEFEIEALLEYVWRRNGSSMPGFGSITGSGENAVTLHYSANNRKMEAGDLLLMDLGAEYGYYTADITRTVPVDGRFTKEQRDIYDLVLRAQKAAIDMMKPGTLMTGPHVAATDIIINGLHDLGLVTDPESRWQRKFYTIYHINHYLGLDVHDAGSLGIPVRTVPDYLVTDTLTGRPLEPGMVLTVEPGIYLRANGLQQLEMLYGSEAGEGEIEAFIEKVGPVYEKYRNIGVRIEDDVLITGDGNRVLSASVPKDADEIERIMKRNHR
jgi:Xaa-Pro aminopeptidase